MWYDCASFSERFWSTTEIPHFSRFLAFSMSLAYQFLSSSIVGFSPGQSWKSPGLKCTEQMAAFFEGSHFALLCFTKFTHFFRLFFACGRSSPKYGIEWSVNPFSKSGVLLQPPATHLVGIFAANSSRATQPLQWNDWRRSTFRSWVDVTTALDPFSPELGRATTWRRFRAIFEFSAGHKKLRIQQNLKCFSQN